MAVSTAFLRRYAAIAVAVAATGLTLPSASAAEPVRSVDWNAVDRTMGTTLTTVAGGVHTAGFLRTDLHVVNAGVVENPGMELGAEAMFHETTPGRVVVIGEATLTSAEMNRVAARLDQGHVEITAIHKHLQDESPRLWWLHYAAYGDPVAIAHTIHAALALTGTPLHPPAEQEPPIPLDTAALDRIIGVKGSNEHGVYQFHVPLAEKVTDTRAHVTLPYLMEACTLLMFQPLGGAQAAVNGDFAMTADQIDPVITALQSHGIAVIELHNHMLHEQPRLFYLHLWATGDAATLARGLRADLDQVHAPRQLS